MSFKYIEVAGTHRQIGRAIGESLREEIGRTLALFLPRLSVARERVVARRSEQLWKVAQTYFPRYTEEVVGLSEGSGFSLGALIRYSFEEELEYAAEHCSSIAVCTPRGFLFGHNEDWDRPMPLYVVKAKPKGQPAYVAASYVGHIPGATGAFINEYGLASAGDTIATRVNYTGLPKTYCLKVFLECRRVADAWPILTRQARTVGNTSIVISAREKSISMVEWTPKHLIVQPFREVVFHTNHLRVPSLAKEGQLARGSTSRRRWAQLEKAVIHGPLLHREDVMRVLQDHTGGRGALCRHGTKKIQDATIASFVVETSTATLWVSDGTPCDTAYVGYRL